MLNRSTPKYIENERLKAYLHEGGFHVVEQIVALYTIFKYEAGLTVTYNQLYRAQH